MFTARVGKEIINILDTTYDKYRLKQWSDKNILKCPVCNGIYKYCHGEIVNPYFRHKGKECEGYYSESETEEHRKGKTLIYNWIKYQSGVSNVKLESWIPETKQRPDIYFEYDSKRYVIEFQCTPIASEFLLRRELYKLAGINDIWILGTDKYNIHIDKKGNPFHDKRIKTIVKELLSEDRLLYLDVARKTFISNSRILSIDDEFKEIIRDVHTSSSINSFDLFHQYYLEGDFLFIEDIDNFIFDNKITLNTEMQSLVNTVKDKYLELKNDIDTKRKIISEKIEIIKEKLESVQETSEYLGHVGDSLETEALLAKAKYFRTYDSTLYKFIDEKGNIITWFTSKKSYIKVGDYVKLTGKIKLHSEYDGVKNTRFIRCSISKEMVN